MMSLLGFPVHPSHNSLLLVALAGTTPFFHTIGQGTGSLRQARDSAGVRIIENSGPSWPTGREWRLGPQPKFSVGGGEVDTPNDLNRVIGPALLSDGRVVIGNGASLQLQFHGPDGAFLVARGRNGDGPGEFRSINAVLIGSNDSVLVFDQGGSRIVVFDRTGKYARTATYLPMGLLLGASGGPSINSVIGWSTNGAVVALRSPLRVTLNRPGIFRDTIALTVMPRGDSTSRHVFQGHGSEREKVDGLNPMPAAFQRRTYVIVAGNTILIADNSAWKVDELDLSGRLKRTIRLTAPADRLTADQVAAHRKALLVAFDGDPLTARMSSDDRTRRRRHFSERRYPSTVPPIAGLFVAQDGHIWVTENDPTGGEQQRLAVFSPAGVFLGRIPLPSGFVATAASGSVVVGRERDEDGVEYVRGYTILKR